MSNNIDLSDDIDEHTATDHAQLIQTLADGLELGECNVNRRYARGYLIQFRRGRIYDVEISDAALLMADDAEEHITRYLEEVAAQMEQDGYDTAYDPQP